LWDVGDGYIAYLVTNLYSQDKLFQISDRDQFDIDLGLEIALVIANQTLEVRLQILDGVKFGLCADGKVISLSHGFASRDILDPLAVVDDIGDLGGGTTIHLTKDGVHERNMLDHQLDVIDVNTIANIVWVFDEDEHARAEEFLYSACDSKGQGRNASP